MIIYVIIGLVLFALSYIDSIYQLSVTVKKLAKIITFLLLVLITGLRWETGTDWIPYTEHYHTIDTFDTTSPLYNGMELGYNIFVWLTKLLVNNYTFYLLVHAVFYYAFIFSSLKRCTPYFFMGLLLFFTSTIGVTGSNRQLIAIVICLYSLKYIINRNPYKFSFLLLIAVSIHTSAFLFGFLYFLNGKISAYILILVLVLAFIIGKTGAPLLIFSVFGKGIGGSAALHATAYLEGAKDSLAEAQLSISGLVKRLIFIIIFFLTKNKLEKVNPYYNIMFNGYLIGLVIYFIFSSTLLIMVNRGSLYFNMFEPILLSCQLQYLNYKSNKLVLVASLWVLSVLYFFQSIVAYPDLFIPYKGIFINQDLKRDVR